MSKNPYESYKYFSEYLLFHYGTSRTICPWPFAPRQGFEFHRRIVRELVVPYFRRRHQRTIRALDVGCAVGRLSFEMARYFGEVVGVDNSRRFIRTAEKLKQGRRIRFSVEEEGEIGTSRLVGWYRNQTRWRVRFVVGDAQKISPKLGSFDAVVAANLIDRLPEPIKFIRALPALVKPGGLLVLTSPYTWGKPYTFTKNWLGGHLKNGRPVWTFAQLKKLLAKDFKLVNRKDLPFIIREHRRKYQLVIAEGTAWIRRKNSQ